MVITSEPASELRIKVKDKGTVLLNYMLGKSFYPVILDYADYTGVDNQVRIYPPQFEKKVLNQLNASTRRNRKLNVLPDLAYDREVLHCDIGFPFACTIAWHPLRAGRTYVYS